MWSRFIFTERHKIHCMDMARRMKQTCVVDGNSTGKIVLQGFSPYYRICRRSVHLEQYSLGTTYFVETSGNSKVFTAGNISSVQYISQHIYPYCYSEWYIHTRTLVRKEHVIKNVIWKHLINDHQHDAL